MEPDDDSSYVDISRSEYDRLLEIERKYNLLLVQVEQLRQEVNALRQENIALRQENIALRQENTALRQENTALQQQRQQNTCVIA